MSLNDRRALEQGKQSNSCQLFSPKFPENVTLISDPSCICPVMGPLSDSLSNDVDLVGGSGSGVQMGQPCQDDSVCQSVA